MKKLKEFDVNILRTHDNFYGENLGDGYTFSSFINDVSVSSSMKLLLRSLVKNPFIVDEDSYEAEIFITHQFETIDYLGNTVYPEGLAVAYVNQLPTLSLVGHTYWESPILILTICNNEITEEKTQHTILNLSHIESTGSQPFLKWLDSITKDIELNSIENIYNIFPTDRYLFEKQAIDDILSWYIDDARYLIKIRELIENIETNPFTGGIGKTEVLTGTSGRASKRIVKKDRIIYTYTKEKIIIHQCRGHYNDT